MLGGVSVPDWLWWGVGTGVGLLGLFALVVTGLQYYYRSKYLDPIVRIFEERPFFIIPRGQPVPGAEDVHFETPGGLTLRGCYLRGHGPRKGVVLFGPEYGANRWAAVPYCRPLLDAGYDLFAFEPRNQGESDRDPGYHPLQWVTDRDVADMKAALGYLRKRKDAPEGVAVFGISKGASVGLILARDPFVKCVVTDGAYGTHTTVVPYMRRWVGIYANTWPLLRRLFPNWFYGLIAAGAIREVARRRGVHFESVEWALRRLRKPLLMIHGEADTYIRPEMATALYDRAGSKAKEFWLVPGAKHNQALTVAAGEYARRLTTFLDRNLAPAAESAAEPDVQVDPGLSGRLATAGAD